MEARNPSGTRRKRKNPNVLYTNSQTRGYLRLDVHRDHLRADLVGLDSPVDARSGAKVVRSYTVEAGRPGLQPA
jgi:alkaline phosphatase D